MNHIIFKHRHCSQVLWFAIPCLLLKEAKGNSSESIKEGYLVKQIHYCLCSKEQIVLNNNSITSAHHKNIEVKLALEFSSISNHNYMLFENSDLKGRV